MNAFDDRMREATIFLNDAYSEKVANAVNELGVQQNLRASDLLSFVRVAFPESAHSDDYSLVMEMFRKRGITGDNRTKQLWSTLAALVLINRFERGPGKRSENRLVAESLAAVAIHVLENQECEPVHPDVVSYARVWRATVAEHLRLRGGFVNPPELPAALALNVAGDQGQSEAAESPDVVAGQDQGLALISFSRELHEWLARSSSPARLLALEEQQGLLWWLTSSTSTVSAGGNVATTVVRACNELLQLTRSFPGPPSWDELLVRRLGKVASKPISRAALSERASRDVPPLIADICMLANGRAAAIEVPDAEMTATEGAIHLFTELVLIALAEGAAR
jgi:hypothetical protein